MNLGRGSGPSGHYLPVRRRGHYPTGRQTLGSGGLLAFSDSAKPNRQKNPIIRIAYFQIIPCEQRLTT
jgi:hypothetical protein